jgi:hypothetical protein
MKVGSKITEIFFMIDEINKIRNLFPHKKNLSIGSTCPPFNIAGLLLLKRTGAKSLFCPDFFYLL